MSLDLDDRRRAMLAEMGVHVWLPAAPVPADPHDPPVPEPVAGVDAVEDPGCEFDVTQDLPLTVAPPPAAPAPPVVYTAPPPGPISVLPLPDGIASMDWPALSTAVAGCQACTMCLGRRAPVLAAPAADLRADWFIVGEPPDEEQERAGQPFVDEAGRLLDNMLKAVGVQRHAVNAPAADSPAAYLTHVLKCRPALPTAPDAQALVACENYLQREIALVQPKVIVAMGRLAMQLLLGQDHPQGLKLPLGKLRGRVWHYQGVPVVVTYPPAYLLRSGQDKARAWEDLCLALDVVQGGPVD